jgi:hypothetical protein
MTANPTFKTVDGKPLPKGDFAYAPSDDPGAWKLPITAEHIEAALDMFAHTDLPASARHGVASRIVSAAERHGVDQEKIKRFRARHLSESESGGNAAPDSRPPTPALAEGRHLATLLSATAKPVTRLVNGAPKQLYEIPIAVVGTWVKRGRKFSITPEDEAAMVRNFRKRKNEQVVIDYEHASETPEVAQGGPVPAAGWIHELTIADWSPLSRGLPIEEGRTIENRQSKISNTGTLCALAEWTEQALGLIKKGAYRFFSPAIDWAYRDKETGEPQGATLTSGALTNHPFLEELPPIMLTAVDGRQHTADGTSVVSCPAPVANAVDGRQHTADGERGQGAGLPSTVYRLPTMATDDGPPTTDHSGKEGPYAVYRLLSTDKGETMADTNNPELHLRRTADGNHGVFDAHEQVGHVTHQHFCDHARATMDELQGAPMSEVFGEAFAERLGATRTEKFSDAKRLIEFGRAKEKLDQESAARTLLLAECLAEAKDANGAAIAGAVMLDDARAMVLARDGKITLVDYIAAQDAQKKLDEAVRAGKILPRDRKFFFRDALERPGEFAEYVKAAPGVIRLGTAGIGSAEQLTADDEVEVRTRKLMKDENLSYAKALKKVLASDKSLADRYHARHRPQVRQDSDVRLREGNGAAADAAAGFTE